LVDGYLSDERRAARQLLAKPLLDDLERWLHATLAALSRKSDTAAAI
jgi:transposase